MSRGIFLIDGNEQLVELREQPYDSEDLLQRLLASYPSLLSGDQINRANPRRWVLVAREAAIPGEQGGSGRWSLDHLFLDQDAIPTLVEVKRSTDTRIRREVVGQMLDYAANAVVYWPVEHLIEQFNGTCKARGADPDAEIERLVDSVEDTAAFWQRVKTNLQAGRIRMLFVADEIPPELRRVVEFLNQQMTSAEVLAVEIKQFTGEGLRTLVPSVIGQTAEAEKVKGTSASQQGRQWDETSFFEDLAKGTGAGEVQVARRLLDWAVQNRLFVYWGRGKGGTFTPVLEHGDYRYQMLTVYGYGPVDVNFQWFATKPPFDEEGRRAELVRRLNEIPGVTIPENVVNKRPTIQLSVLGRGDNLARFLEILDWFVQQVRGTSDPSLES